MNFRSPHNSPFSKIRECSSSSSISISGYPIGNAHKSPCNRDRFVGTYKSPKRCSSVNENKQEYEMGCGTPGTPKSSKRPPQVTSKLLDAPDVLNDFPLKLIDVNQNHNAIAIALGTNVYIYKDGNSVELMDGNTQINGVCWVGDDLAISGDGHIELWDVNQQSPFEEFRDHNSRASALASYGNRFATGGDDGLIYLYDIRDKSCQRMNAHPNNEVCALSWSLDGNALASSGTDNYVNVISKKKMRLPHGSPVHALAWMNSGILLTGEMGHEGVVHAFHTRSDDPPKTVYTGSPVSGICVTDQWGLLIAHNDEAGTWDIWNPDLSKKISDYHGHRQGILNISASIEGSLVATISADESLCIWDLKPSVLTPIQSPRYGANNLSPGYRNNTVSRTSPYQQNSRNIGYPYVR
ncbi:hypothetical protein TRFO_17372 [Tritrichomonas foetus]|uniref:Anaphase-promoting complex subunit 4 WD40 domain-containing protein n=1 Tax=Tritrichomonas foetus TaxID=1144522 RepID=A0A1J4KSF5_9EUKA|nr:hypothetical protein TRFO_17372 [Tritrichomonas foetus]|eukprot:OHT12740.1 hypothetical protein TRFO_17372 [Tritrichomonas foetus]